jgi:hypothetical protein
MFGKPTGRTFYLVFKEHVRSLSTAMTTCRKQTSYDTTKLITDVLYLPTKDGHINTTQKF